MNRSPTRPPLRWLLVALLLVFVLPIAACGGSQVSQVFSNIDSGLREDAPIGSSEPQPQREDNRAAEGNEAPADTGDITADRAAAPTAAPLATAAPSAPAPELEKPAEAREEEYASGLDGTGLADDESIAAGEPPLPLPSPESDSTTRRGFEGGPAPLKAGEIDDNEQFQDYLDYLSSYQGSPVRTADISERYVIRVLDGSQRPLLDAQVRIYDEQDQQVFAGRTYAGGQTLFLPRALAISDNAARFRVVASKGNSQVETTFERNTAQQIELALPDTQPPDALRLDVLFLLDTTGSMADELTRIQETIDSIAQRIDAFEPRPEVRFALVAYRDEGDTYVTRDYDFTPDVAAFREILSSFEADGGGDTPEALDEALHQAVHDVQWADDAVRLVFLVADAGPHTERELNYSYLSDAQQAVAKGVKIYPIAASNTDEQAEYVFRQLAQQTMGHFIFLTYQPGESSGAPGETTTLEAGEQQFTVERLDDLIVQVIERELAAAIGAQ